MTSITGSLLRRKTIDSSNGGLEILKETRPDHNMTDKMLYWKGCMSRMKTIEIADATERLMDKLGIDYDTLGEDEGCCGSVLLRTGQTDAAKEVAKRTLELIKSRGYDKVVTSCPGCFKAMSKEYEKMFGSVPFKVCHISQLLFENRKGFVGHLRRWNISVSYHDPCHLGRHMGIYEEPRSLIEMVPGIKLVEFTYNRGKALCCGSGGGVRSTYPEISQAVAKMLLVNRPSKVNIIITACPFCNYNLKEAGSIEIIDLPEFLIRAWRD